MKVIGIIGGIGTGKSTISEILRVQGGHVISSDEISHRILEPDGVAYDEVLAEFGTVERPKLASIVFSDNVALAKLNQITHKHIAATIKSEIDEIKCNSGNKSGKFNENDSGNGVGFIVLEVPLPIKGGFLDVADCVWAVTANEETRICRLCEQRGFSEADARARIANQPPEEAYEELADVVIDNSSEFETANGEGASVGSQLESKVIKLLNECLK